MRTDGRYRGGLPSALLLAIGLMPLVTGCPTPAENGNENSGTDGTGSLVDSGTDANASFDTAGQVLIDGEGKADFTSRLDAEELDIYSIGALQVGDRILIDVAATSGDLDPTAALFDDSENLVAFNDDRNQQSGSLNLNPLLDTHIAEGGRSYFLAVTPFPGDPTSGGYRVRITISRPTDAAGGSGQLVYFDWRGGSNITVPNVGNFNLAAFDAADVGLPSSQTAGLKSRVKSFVEARFSRFKLTILSSDDVGTPAEAHSLVVFGGFNRAAFGISEQIDDGNKDASDVTIIFTESFNGAFGLAPTLERVATALGNTTAHELGHLVGLVHTANCADLMDTTCGNDSILNPQEFQRAAIDDSVFPIGFQDSAAIIGWVLGLSGN